MSWFSDQLTKIGVLEKEAPVASETIAPSQATLSNAVTNGYGITGASLPVVNDELLSVLMINASKVVVPNHLDAISDMADTLKAAIVDEGTRIKAAAAALKIGNQDVNKSVEELLASLDKEKANFMSTDVASMDAVIATGEQELATILKKIEETILTLNDFTSKRDVIVAEVNNNTSSRDIAIASFEATLAKAKAIVESERGKINLYLPRL